jgi:hypothetical protein
MYFPHLILTSTRQYKSVLYICNQIARFGTIQANLAEMIAARYLAEMRIHHGATFMPSKRLRQRAAALAAAVPPAVLLAAAGLAAAELFHGHPVTLHHLARRAAAAPLLDARQARRTLPLVACHPAPMRPAR